MKDKKGKTGKDAFNGISKKTAVIAVYVALVVAAQAVLSFAAGVEVVSLLICVFCVVFGLRMGMVMTISFVILRGLIFPYTYLNILIDYALYFPIFALVTGLYGKLLNGLYGERQTLAESGQDLKNPVFRTLNAKCAACFAVLTVICAALTCLFTLIDDAVWPLVFHASRGGAIAYFYNSLPTLVTHVVCVTVSMAFLFNPAYKALDVAKRGLNG